MAENETPADKASEDSNPTATDARPAANQPPAATNISLPPPRRAPSQAVTMYAGLLLIIFSGLCGFAVYKYVSDRKGADFNVVEVVLTVAGMLLALFTVIMGSRIMMNDISTPKVVIPTDDRELLEELIRKSENGVSEYVRLSSLTGVTGSATQLGLTGLPMATVGLTIFFALGSIFHADGFLDLTKLTLGAFIGSFVQRNVSGDKARTGAKDDTGGK